MDDLRGNDLNAFNERLAKAHLRGQWTADGLMQKTQDGPSGKGVPHIWHYDDVLAYLREACTEFPEALHARRNLTFDNPGLDRYTTHTLAAGIQLIQPNELAWPHRHTAAALRFVIDGAPDLFTMVNGTAYPMENYDLILTPNWAWHGHENQSNKVVTWLDLLDVPFIWSLNQAFFEPGEPGRMQTGAGEDAAAGPMRFRWADIEAALRRAPSIGAMTSTEGIVVPYTDPGTRGPTLPTVSCQAHLLQPGETTKQWRRTASAVFFVVNGAGKTIVDGTELNWSKHDTFCIPNWSWHQHVNLSPEHEALLFSITDEPMLRPFNLYREQVQER